MPYQPRSHFSIAELGDREETVPQLYVSNQTWDNDATVDYDGSMLTISMMNKTIVDSALSKKLQNPRHDTVFSVLGDSTDMELGMIGITGSNAGLTPDFISVKDKSVIELTTTFNPELKSLTSAYDEKVRRYGYLVEPEGFKLMVIVVSMSCVFSNMKLTQDVVDNLCYRMRLGITIETLIDKVAGKDRPSKELGEDEKKVERNLASVPLLAKSNDMFDLEAIASCGKKPKKEHYKKTGLCLNRALGKAKKKSTETQEDLERYLGTFDTHFRSDDKRITNIPMVSLNKPCSHSPALDPEEALGLPSYIRSCWSQARSVKTEELEYGKIILESMGKAVYDKHRIQKSVAFNVSLTDDQRVEAATSGLWAKSLDTHEVIKEKQRFSKKSFHPTRTSTEDIEDFIKNFSLSECPTNIPLTIKKLIFDTKKIWNKSSLSKDLLSRLLKTKAACLGQTISSYMTEIAYCYKYWPKRADFYHKETNGIHMLVRTTGTHIFVSYAFPICCSTDIDTGRLGPGLFYSENYIFTDFCSYNEPTLEHFVKAGPYLTTILCHLLSHYEMPLDNVDLNSRKLKETFNTILLLYLNNKTDVEELITSQRYLTMGVLEELDPNPYRFVSRLPEVLRSRLTCHFLKRTLRAISWYGDTSIKKVPTGQTDDPDVEYKGILSIVGDFEVTLKQKINEFYFGYVISKERGRGSDRNFKIIKKIIKEEYAARDTVKKTLDDSLNPKTFTSNPIVIRVFMSMFKDYMKRLYGSKWKDVLHSQAIFWLARTSFSELATLKVSSRSYKSKLIIPHFPPGLTTKEIQSLFEESNPEEKEKRPRVMEALAKLVEEYVDAGNTSPTHLSDLVPYCMARINQKGYFDSDLFPKPQHGGDREIHVLEMMARVVQYHLETIARAFSRMIPCDALTHPSDKGMFVQKHYRDSAETLGSKFFTLGKSADATKWCQRNHCSKFAAVLIPLLKSVLVPFALSILYFWLFKRISFPVQFAANLVSNQSVESDPLYKRMQSEFMSGTGIFSEPQNNKMMISFGMMQGILHFVSTLTHAVVMVVMMINVSEYYRRRGIKTHISIISGSDDSAMLLSVQGKLTTRSLRLATTMLHWKEKVSEYFSIYCNRAKSSVGTLDLVEFNSEWSLRGQIMKPTFRWVSACLETTVVERFIDRIRNNYNILGQVLEGGGKLLECAVIQMCQAWMHYMMLGLHTSPLSIDVAQAIWNLKDPSIGFYPLDSDFCCGIPGVDFQLYHLIKRTAYSRMRFETQDPDFLVDNELADSSVSKDLRAVRIKFGSLKIYYDMLRRMSIPQLVDLVEEVEDNPRLIFQSYRDWDRSKYQIYLKIFQPGVKESLSSYSPTIRMMAASSYLISRPAITVFVGDEIRKVSLYQLVTQKEYIDYRTERTTEEVIRSYPYHEEYDDLMQYVDFLENSATFHKMNLKSRTKQKIQVFEKHVDDIPVLEMCKRKWDFPCRVALASRQFDDFWAEMKLKYPYLADTLEETKVNLKMSTIEVKNYLESLESKPRSIVLMDTAAKSASLKSAVTRIFWPGVKIVTPKTDSEQDSYDLRSKIFTILTFWGTNIWKKDAIRDIFKDNQLLSAASCPVKVDKLKIIRDYEMGVDKAKLVRRIERKKMGSIGYFTVCQEGYGKNRKGLGEWRGKCMGVPTIIEMMNTTCTKVTMSTLQGHKENGKVVSDLIKSFGMDWPKTQEQSEYWITESGKVLWGKGRSDAVPLTIDTETVVKFVDEISEMKWAWEIAGTKIRLLAEMSRDAVITILSDSFSSRDWDPTVGFKDPLLSNWAQGTPIPLMDFEREIASCVPSTHAGILKAIKDPLKLSAGGWSIDLLVKTLKDFIHQELGPDEGVEVLDVGDLEDLMRLANSFDEDDLEEGEENIFDDEDGSEVLFEMDDDDLDEVEAQLDIFDVAPPEALSESRFKWGMPTHNQAFGGLETLCRVHFGLSFPQTVSRFRSNSGEEVSGFLGIILSLITGRVCIPGRSSTLDRVMSQIEVETTTIMSSLIEDNDYLDLDERAMEANIAFLEDQVIRAPVSLKPIMKRNLENLQRILLFRNRPSEPEELEQTTIMQFLLKVKEEMGFKNCLPSKILTLEDPIFVSVVRSILNKNLQTLYEKGERSARELALINESIGKQQLSTFFLDHFSETFDFSVKTCGYETGDNPFVV